jgi:hypothetical protein
MVNGEAIDIATLCTLASTTVRLSQRLGLERRARNVTPSLGQYLAIGTFINYRDNPSKALPGFICFSGDWRSEFLPLPLTIIRFGNKNCPAACVRTPAYTRVGRRLGKQKNAR